MTQYRKLFLTTFTLLLLSSCSANPFRTDNELTGSATGTAVGAVAGGGVAAIAGASKVEIGLAAIAGGALGYYITSLPFASGGVTHVGGKVYTLGDYVTIEIPNDVLFDVNSADFLPDAGPVLDSAVSVLNRYPSNNIMVSGNTSGYYTDKFERQISQARARQVAAYLWAHGINNFNDQNSNYGSTKDHAPYMRKLSYVGYGSYFPISNNITLQGIQENSRIQITAYPSDSQLHLNKCGEVFTNIGSPGDDATVPSKEPELGMANQYYSSKTIS
jgi:outer membrane protein OmpA-like peptidoglycan-associated protein